MAQEKKLSFREATKLGGTISLQGKLYQIAKIAKLEMTSAESFRGGDFISTSRINLIAELIEIKTGVSEVLPSASIPPEVRAILTKEGEEN